MKYKFKFLILYLFPGLYLQAEELATNFSLDPSIVPEEFISYYYNNELPTQIWLNDQLLFEGEIRLHPSGEVKLERIIQQNDSGYDNKIIQLWQKRLQQGVKIGRCEKSCSLGLMRVDYQLNHAALKLYSDNYEISQLSNHYLPTAIGTPAGAIFKNSLHYSYNGDNKNSFSFYPSLLFAFKGWTLNTNASFWHNSDSLDKNKLYSSALNNFYLEKQLQGYLLNLGVFTPSYGFSTVRIGQGSERMIGAFFGSSDNLRHNYDTVSIYPVYVTGRNQSVAEVYLDNKLIYTQNLVAGIQPLDTKSLQNGNYDIVIKVRQNGEVISEQEATIYKPTHWNNAKQRLQYYLWGGRVFHKTWFDIEETEEMRKKKAQEKENKKHNSVVTEGDYSVGAGVDILLHPKVILSIAGSKIGPKVSAEARANIYATDTLHFTPEIFYSNQQINYYRLNVNKNFKNSRLHMGWRNQPCYSNQCITFNSLNASFSSTIGKNLRFTLQGEYSHTEAEQGLSASLGINSHFNLADRTVNWHVKGYDRTNHISSKAQDRNRGIELGIDFPLQPDHRGNVNIGLENEDRYINFGHSWQPIKHPWFSNVHTQVELKKSHAYLYNNIGINTKYLQGNASLSASTEKKQLYGNLNLNNEHNLVFSNSSIALSNAKNNFADAALIVEVESDNPDIKLQVSGSSNRSLMVGKNVLALQPWREHDLQFYSDDKQQGTKIYPQFHSIRLNRGSVGYLKVKAVKTHTLVGSLVDENGTPILQREIASDIMQGYVNEEGIFTIDASIKNKMLIVNKTASAPELKCQFELSSSEQEKEKLVHFITAQCKK